MMFASELRGDWFNWALLMDRKTIRKYAYATCVNGDIRVFSDPRAAAAVAASAPNPGQAFLGV
jgi:hypothetical protein